MKVKEVTDLVGISVRTLQHILFHRELGFPLKEIKEIIDNSLVDRQEALQTQYQMLLRKKQRLIR